MRFALAFSALFLVVAVPVGAAAAPLRFRPAVSSYFGEFELNVLHSRLKRESGDRETEQSRTIFREQLTLGLYGYSYHPNFLVYLLKATVGLEERREEQRDGDYWRTGSAEEFEFRAKLLQNHPYNLEMFSILSRPLITGQYADSDMARKYHSGAILRYEKKPWLSALSYDYYQFDGGQRHSESDTYRANLGYFKQFYSLMGNYQHSETSVSDGEESTRDLFYIENNIDYRPYRLLSAWELSTEDKVKAGSIQEYRNQRWLERLTVDLPWNFQTRLTSEQIGDEYTEQRSTGQETARSTDFENYAINLNHRLYQSLTSNFLAQFTNSESSGGEVTQEQYLLNFDYRKNLYGKNNLMVGFNTGKSILEREGAPLLLREPHQATAFDRIFIANPSVDISTIGIIVVDPVDPNLTATLVPGFHFTAFDAGERTEIIILQLPAAEGFTQPADAYQYLITYALETSRFEIETVSYGYSLRFNLFDNLLSPHYSHRELEQEITAGSRDLPPDELKEDIFGMIVSWHGYRAGTEYRRLVSVLYPERNLLFFADYERQITADSLLRLRLEWEKKTLMEGPGRPDIIDERIEKLLSGMASISRSIRRYGLNASLSGSASRFESISETDLYSLNSALTWHRGKIHGELRGTYSHSWTTGPFLPDTERINRSVYLKIVRKLF
jgi:hypothetical protein